MANRPTKISRDDFIIFCMQVHELSATMLPFEEYYEIYENLLRVMFWNPDIDTAIVTGERHV